MNDIQRDLDFELWLDEINQSFFNNLDAELDAMADYYSLQD